MNWGILEPTYLLLGYCFGFVIRLGVVSLTQIRSTRGNPALSMFISSGGLLLMLFVWIGLVDPIFAVWAFTLAGVGWFHAGNFIERSRHARTDVFFSDYNPQS
jgi:hypothetical protein